MAKIRADQLLEAVQGQLEDYASEITDGVLEAIEQTAKEALQRVKLKSPVGNRGRYKKGWRLKEVFRSGTSARYRVQNATDWQLTHLLEYGHDLSGFAKGGGRVPAKPHISPAYEQAEKDLEKKIRKVVEGTK